MKKANTKDFNVGMLGAIVGATVAVSLLNKDNRKKVMDEFGNTLMQDVKKQAFEMWEDFKKKGDAYLEETAKKGK